MGGVRAPAAGPGESMHCMCGDAVAVGRYPQANRSTSKAVYHRPR